MVLLVLAVLGFSSCGGSDDAADSSAPASTSTTTTATDTGGIDTLEGAGTEPVTAPAEGHEIALLERVALARHEGYDRVVFQFRNVLPGYRVEYVEPPLHEDGSGNVVDIEGTAFVQVRMELASGFDLSVDEGEMIYVGPRRFSGTEPGTSVVRELVRTGDFEAVLTWAVGLGGRVDFRVLTLDGPPRVVVDFRNH